MRRTWAVGQICEHGSLGRQCELCERDDEIADLRAKLAEAKDKIRILATMESPRCHECLAELSECGEMGADGVPKMDCKQCQLRARLALAERVVKSAAPIRDLIVTVENRAMASDGPVTPTFREMTPLERAHLEKLLGHMCAALAQLTERTKG